MGIQSYILLVKNDDDKNRIINALIAHNNYKETITEEQYNNPLLGFRYTKLLKNRPKKYQNYTHAIRCCNEDGSRNTFNWFDEHQINCLPHTPTCDNWLSNKVMCVFSNLYL